MSDMASSDPSPPALAKSSVEGSSETGMVERVAAAIGKLRFSVVVAATNGGDEDAARTLARTAIEAMRHPGGFTETAADRAITQATCLAMERERLSNISIGSAWAVREAVIDAALKD